MRIAIFILTFLLSVSGFAQQGTYTRIFSGPLYDEGIAAFRLPNKEIRLIGNTGSFGHGNTDVWLIALDSNANFLWHKFYGGPNIEKVESALMTSSGDIFMVGSTTQNTSSSYQVYFLGLDIYGQIISYKNYGGADWDLGHGICKTSDSTFVLVGESFSYSNGQSDVYVLKVNRLGDTLWTRNYGGIQKDIGHSIELLNDGGLIIAGSSQSYGNGTFDSYMLHLNAFGDTIWTNTLPYKYDAEFLDVVENPDSSYIFCGYEKDTTDSYRDIAFVKIDSNGSYMWSSNQTLSEGEDCYAKSIIRETDGGHTFAGMTTKYSNSAQPSARILRTTHKGYWKASKSLGDENKDMANFISFDHFNGKHYFMMGTTKSYGVSRSALFFVRLDSNFNYDTTRIIDLPTSLIETTDNQQINIYPNPVQDLLYIDLSTIKEKCELKVYDAVGRLVLSRKINSTVSNYPLSVQKLDGGVYHLVIISQKKQYQASILKIIN